MLKTLFICYNQNLGADLTEKFDKDFKLADKILLCVIFVFSLIVATVTPWQYGYFKLDRHKAGKGNTDNFSHQ